MCCSNIYIKITVFEGIEGEDMHQSIRFYLIQWMCEMVTSHHGSVILMNYLANQNHGGEHHLQTNQDGSQSEWAETQQHVQHGDVMLTINYFQIIFWPLAFF